MGVKVQKIILVLFICLNLLVVIPKADAANYSKVSNNPKIVLAINSLESINRRDVISILQGNNATKQPIKIMFKDLSIYGYEGCEAITMKTKKNGLVIYIDNEHKNASPECIACLIAHEAQHHTFTNSKAEELKAWISETQAWSEFVKRNHSLAQLSEPLAKRENYLSNIRIKGGVQGIKKLIAVNPAYAELN